MSISQDATVALPSVFSTEIMMDLREEIRDGLLRHALGNRMNEAKGAGSWWDALSMDGKNKMASMLGFKLGKKVAFTALNPSLQSELEAYFAKHRGKVESVM
jgi:hypothetical protein